MTHPLAPRRIGRALAVGFALLLPFQAGALSIIIEPSCVVNPADGQVVPYGQGASHWEGVGTSSVGDGIVTWDYTTDRGNWAAIVQICRSNRAMVVDFPGADGGQAERVFYDMVFGENAYTLRNISDAMRGLGAQTRTARNYYGSCVCDAAGY